MNQALCVCLTTRTQSTLLGSVCKYFVSWATTTGRQLGRLTPMGNTREVSFPRTRHIASLGTDQGLATFRSPTRRFANEVLPPTSVVVAKSSLSKTVIGKAKLTLAAKAKPIVLSKA